jgi:hypothetical protein
MHGFISEAAPSPQEAVTGRFLAHNHLSPHRRAFLGADLVLGRLQLVRPTTV